MTTSATSNQNLLKWVDEMASLCQPEKVHWCDGSQAEYDELFRLMIENNTAVRLNEKKRPNSYLI
jgi:phosphoenolpyruvate carboxykinase (GTP)